MVINDWSNIQNYVDTIVDELKANTPNNTGRLKDSIDVTLNPSESGAEITVSMLYYGEFVDQGVNGTQVNWGSPYSFTNKRPPASAFASYTTDLSEQFAIANSVYKNGIKPRDFIDPVIDTKLQGLADLVANTIWENFFTTNNNTKTITVKVW